MPLKHWTLGGLLFGGVLVLYLWWSPVEEVPAENQPAESGSGEAGEFNRSDSASVSTLRGVIW